jgi:hypothetical protein
MPCGILIARAPHPPSLPVARPPPRSARAQGVKFAGGMSRPHEGAASDKKSLLPCTPLAIVKLMEYLKVYDEALPIGDRMAGKSVVVINRSEIVGRPLAAMLANDGADVYSVDLNGVYLMRRGKMLEVRRPPRLPPARSFSLPPITTKQRVLPRSARARGSSRARGWVGCVGRRVLPSRWRGPAPRRTPGPATAPAPRTPPCTHTSRSRSPSAGGGLLRAVRAGVRRRRLEASLARNVARALGAAGGLSACGGADARGGAYTEGSLSREHCQELRQRQTSATALRQNEAAERGVETKQQSGTALGARAGRVRRARRRSGVAACAGMGGLSLE